ncbi:hypothetical protein CWI75_01135 [Kineobactrum sediminis]|uniref:Flagellar protein FlgJ N-terminal domain-containing protein n=1 Tax=Kineobactrum sediminis TaxID=1905677 RepID=A0A2N5Y6H0_9GAMM|nr:rod-binding protein [Kineobactrum sediminis]PLW83986.1 hypothetical protein CWI75_01135 [Kineobactrum sediminis]
MAAGPVNQPGFAANAAEFSSLRAAARRDDPAAVREAAEQFEALLVQTMFKEMRAASSSEDDLFGSKEMGTYYEMFDRQVALDMSRNGGMGLADMLVRQLTTTPALAPGAEPQATPAAASGTAGPALPLAAAREPIAIQETLAPAAMELTRARAVQEYDTAEAGAGADPARGR